MKVGLGSIVRQNPDEDQVWTELGDEVVMMSLERGSYYNLDELGSQIWKRIEQPVEVRALCEELMEAFQVDRAQCERDVLAFLEELAGDRLIEVSEPPASSRAG